MVKVFKKARQKEKMYDEVYNSVRAKQMVPEGTIEVVGFTDEMGGRAGKCAIVFVDSGYVYVCVCVCVCVCVLFIKISHNHAIRACRPSHSMSLARGQGNIIFPVQLTTSRIGSRTRLIHTML